MEKIQKEICDELILHANNKKEVKIAMIETFPSTPKAELREYIEKQWLKKIPSKRISFRFLEYREKKTSLENLLYRKKHGDIKKIYMHIRKGLSKETPFELYVNIIGKANYHQQGRDSLRGKRIELMSFSNDMGRILVEDAEWEGKQFYFTIWDINCSHYIEIE